MKIIRINAPRRCGNHAIRTWITGALKIGFREENNLNDGKLPLSHHNLKELDLINQCVVSGCETLVVGYENFDIGQLQYVQQKVREYCCERNIPLIQSSILVLRDWKNWVASVVALNKKNTLWAGCEYLFRPDVWKSIAKWRARNDYNEWYSPDFFFVNFNQWFTSPSYRARKAIDLGIPVSDAGINSVSSFAGGSSFDGLDFNGRAQQMNILERFKQVESDQFFQQQMRDMEAVELSNKIFGM